MKAPTAIAIALITAGGLWWYMKPRIVWDLSPDGKTVIFELSVGGNKLNGTRTIYEDSAIDYPIGGYSFKVISKPFDEVLFQIWNGAKLVDEYHVVLDE